MSKSYKITPDQFKTLMGKAVENGVTVSGNSLSSHGVTMNYTYSNDELILTITHKSFLARLVSDEQIFTEIESAAGIKG